MILLGLPGNDRNWIISPVCINRHRLASDLGAIQVLRNADGGGGGGVQFSVKKTLRRCKVQRY